MESNKGEKFLGREMRLVKLIYIILFSSCEIINVLVYCTVHTQIITVCFHWNCFISISHEYLFQWKNIINILFVFSMIKLSTNFEFEKFIYFSIDGFAFVCFHLTVKYSMRTSKNVWKKETKPPNKSKYNNK